MKFFFVLLILGTLLFSCEKNEQNIPKLSNCMLNAIKIGTGEVKLTYDGQGNLTRLSNYENEAETYHNEFTYTSSQIIEQSFSGGILSGTAYYTLGTDRLPLYAVSSSAYYVDSTYYSYDSYGFLINLKKRYYLKNGNEFRLSYTLTEEYTITNGNRTHEKETMKGDYNYVQDVDYEYYGDKPYYGGLNGEYPFLGKSNTSLLKKQSYTQDSYTTTMNYQYEFDTDNKPVKLTITNSSANGSDVVTGTLGYICN